MHIDISPEPDALIRVHFKNVLDKVLSQEQCGGQESVR